MTGIISWVFREWSETEIITLEKFLRLPSAKAHIHAVVTAVDQLMKNASSDITESVWEQNSKLTVREALEAMSTTTGGKRLWNQLLYYHVETLEDLSKLTVADFLRFQSLGRKSLKIADQVLTYHGFKTKWIF